MSPSARVGFPGWTTLLVLLVWNGPGLFAQDRSSEKAAPTPVRAAGIEVGGKGVKCTVVEGRAGPEGFLYKRVFGKTTNTTLSALRDSAFDPDAINETAEAIAAFVRLVREEYKVPLERIHVVGSSGLPRPSNLSHFVKAVKAATGKDIQFIDDDTEVALSILGIVPSAFRDQALLLDIGSGNTKGGYKPAGKPLASAAVPFGTVTFTNRVREEMKKSKSSFADAAVLLRSPLLVRPLRAEAAKMTELARRQRVYLSGGMVWALATLLHPEEIDNPYVRLSPADIHAFRALVRKTPGEFPRVDLSGIRDAEKRKRADKELRTVADTFTPDNLLAGAEILEALLEAFDLEGKTLVFPRMAFVGWIAAYVIGEGLDAKPREPAPKKEEK